VPLNIGVTMTFRRAAFEVWGQARGRRDVLKGWVGVMINDWEGVGFGYR
jgi:hypothetical protein